jgi:hypothetical protein
MGVLGIHRAQSAITVYADDLHGYYSLFLELVRGDKNWREWVG